MTSLVGWDRSGCYARGLLTPNWTAPQMAAGTPRDCCRPAGATRPGVSKAEEPHVYLDHSTGLHEHPLPPCDRATDDCLSEVASADSAAELRLTLQLTL